MTRKNETLKNKKKKMPVQWYLGKIFGYGFLILTAILYLVPFVFAISTSFTKPANIYGEFSWIPQPIDIGNYAKFFAEKPVFKSFINTILYITPPILVGVMASALAAYAFARIDFKGKNVIFYILLSTIVIPGVITMVPSYVLFSKYYGWAGTPLPIIIPGMFGCAMTMFFLNQYFRTLPKELEEAAEIDGMNKIGIFFKIILPLSIPAFITQIILSFNGCYNDYLGPLMYLGASPKLYTVQLVVQSVQTSLSHPYTLMMAAAMTALVPTLILYVCCQKYFVEGIAMTGLK